MYVLKCLGDPDCEKRPHDSLCAEYRLLCSGTVHRQIIGDWSKSEVARFLLAPPLLLYAASRPFEEYPLELVLRLTVARVEESVGGTLQDSFHPDEEVARDLAALLTVLCRRLITVSGKSMELYADCKYPEFGYVPFPVATSMRKTYWPPHPATVETSVHGQKVHDNNPTPKSVDPEALTALLLGLASLDYGESIVASARLYALSMELIREQPDIANQLLISSVETIANKALQGFQPNDEDKVKLQEAVFKQAKGVGLGDDIARDLALTASKRERWVKRKFTKFLTDNIDDSVWNQDDDLFKPPLRILPCREDLQKTLGKIYDARSTATHSGRQFPASASYSGGPQIPARMMSAFFGSDSVFPPIAWFERVVNVAIRKFWERSMSGLPTTPATAAG